jgi:quercetin dioxygenase-like cupin family protein
MTLKDREMSDVTYGSLGDAEWINTGTPGLDYAGLRRHANGEGASIFLRFAAGAIGADHSHPEGEELYVVSGDITIGGRRLKPGDYLYTPPGASHEAVAHTDSVLFLSFPKPPVFANAA